MKKITLCAISALTLLTMMMTGCSFSVGTTPDSAKSNTNSAPANKPANAPSNANSSGNTGTATKKEPAQSKLENEKKPEGAKSTKAKEVPVPADWIYVYNEKRGYGFSVPAGTTGGGEVVDGVDVYMAKTPSEIGILVFAFKDAKQTKEDLLNHAETVLKELGVTIQAGKLEGESDDYAVAEATMTGGDGGKSKAKVLVGTDVTDNYVMIVGIPEDKYAANQKIIDEIWGSFEMWSGGASGNN